MSLNKWLAFFATHRFVMGGGVIVVGVGIAGYLFWFLVFADPKITVPPAAPELRLETKKLTELTQAIAARQHVLAVPLAVAARLFLPPPSLKP